jgi:lysophospholipase L1-like esterase
MFVINNDDNSIYATRGDIVLFSVTAEDEGVKYQFQPGDVVRIKVYGRKDAENVVLQKDFPVGEACDAVEIFLSEEDTKIGEVISKPTDYWYEVELNPLTNPQTIIGYDEDGAKVFKLFPEGDDVPEYVPEEEEDIPLVDRELDLASPRPVENQAISKAFAQLEADTEVLIERTGVMGAQLNNLLEPDVFPVSQSLEYLDFITENTKAKIDGTINSDGVFATVTINLREANLVYSGTAFDVFAIPGECRPIDIGLVHTEFGLEFRINYDKDAGRYYMSFAAESGVSVAPTEAGTVTFRYALDAYEVKDVRLGADGVVYPTAGDAVRAQTESKVDFADKTFIDGEWEDIWFTTDGYRLDANGEAYEEAGYSVTNFVDMRNCYGVFRHGTGDSKYYRGAICFYDGGKNFIERCAATLEYEFIELNGIVGTLYPMNSKARYMRLETENGRGFSYAFIHKYTNYKLSGRFEEHPTHEEMHEAINDASIESGETGVCFGDSLTQGVGVLPQNQGAAVPTEDVASVMASILHCNMVNAGIGGTTMSAGAGSFCSLADAITTGNFAEIDSLIETLIANYPGQGFEGLTTQFAKVKALDFVEVDFITVAYGTNDWTAGKAIDNAANPLDKTTVCGGLRYGIKTLLAAFPHLRIYVFTPVYRDGLGANKEDSDTFKNATSGLLLPEIADGIVEVCNELHIPCKNMYVESNINASNWNHYKADNTHRNAKGYKLLGTQYAKFVASR